MGGDTLISHALLALTTRICLRKGALSAASVFPRHHYAALEKKGVGAHLGAGPGNASG